MAELVVTYFLEQCAWARLSVQRMEWINKPHLTRRSFDLREAGGDYDVAALRIRGEHMLPRLRDTVVRAHELGVVIVTSGDTSYGPNSLLVISNGRIALARLEFGRKVGPL